MERPGDTASLEARAAEAVASGAERAAVAVRTLTKGKELALAADLFVAVWQTPFPPELLRAFELSGNYVGGAFDEGGRLVAASVAFACVADERELHSHSTAVAADHRHAGVGVVMKLHQRWWALERGIGVISWTFDPLIKRNANFNLARLAATAAEYVVNAYGVMDDALNGRDESDRLWAHWNLADPEVEAAASGRPRRVQVPPGAVARLQVGRHGRPVVRAAHKGDEQAFTCQVPDDIELLRRSEPELASTWRFVLRETLGGSLSAGARLLGLNDEGDYVIAPATRTP
ncbi:MAG: GNAT family N-acetyltransferase [Acidimicrobiales bacterium]|jgi:predicted GNAT superfamily acetyltransferase